MPVVIGDLTVDPSAESFISLADADAYLAPEQHEAWSGADIPSREAALVRASRWLAGAYRWRALDAAGVARVGHVSARLAAETIGRQLFAGIDTSAVVQSERVGDLSVTYATGIKPDAASMAWPWLKPALAGLVLGGTSLEVLRA